jgi:hypothetical protein
MKTKNVDKPDTMPPELADAPFEIRERFCIMTESGMGDRDALIILGFKPTASDKK